MNVGATSWDAATLRSVRRKLMTRDRDEQRNNKGSEDFPRITKGQAFSLADSRARDLSGQEPDFLDIRGPFSHHEGF